jgi:septum formation protein
MKIGDGRTTHHHISQRGFQIDAGLYHPRVSLILASASPRRRELLTSAGITVEVDPVAVDERREPGESAEAYVERVARLKASAGAERHPDRPVLGADTIVVVDADVLGKPEDAEDAARMLRRLAGRTHSVLTAVALAWQGQIATQVERTEVAMSAMSEEDISWYVASGEPLDKAGAYAIQGLASRFVTRIEGSYSNVVGLPVSVVVALLRTPGVVV